MQTKLIFGWIVSLVVTAGVASMLTYRLSKTPKVPGATPSATGTTTRTVARNAPQPNPPGKSRTKGQTRKHVSSGPQHTVKAPKQETRKAAATPQPTLQHDSLKLADTLPLTDLSRLEVAPVESGDAVKKLCTGIAGPTDGLSVKQCLEGRFQDSGRRSANGHPLIMGHVAAAQSPSSGRILLIGASHGDEPSTIPTVLAWMRLMRKERTPYDWRIIPVLNPDGVLAEPETRYNGHGVDLNRNMPTPDWTTKSRAYWRRVGFKKRRYPGPSPGSETENKWLMHVIRTFKPDVIITLHAPYGLLDYDGPPPVPQAVGNLEIHRLGVYPGSLGNYAAHGHGIPVMTLELESARQPPSSKQRKRMWRDLNTWINRYLHSTRSVRAHAPPAQG